MHKSNQAMGRAGWLFAGTLFGAGLLVLQGCGKQGSEADKPVAAASSAPAENAPASGPLKVGFVYVGPVGDAGWTYAHDQGRKAMESALGDRVKTSYVESVAEGADSERVIRQLASQGNQLIFTTSFGYMNPTLKVAQSFPKVIFEHCTGYKQAANVGTYQGRFYEGAYLLGVTAGKMTKTNTLGFVGSVPIPEVIRNIDAFTLGARSVNPKVQTRVIWVNGWYDPAKEREAAETLIAQGADMLAQNTDSPAVVQVAQEKGVHAFGWDSDMSKFGPKAHLTASVINWGGYYTQTAKAVLDGSWKPQDTWWGLKQDMIALAPFSSAVPADVAEYVNGRKQAIIEGRLQPFQGPIRDQSGQIKVTEGKSLSDPELLGINWYVEGVQGSIPK